MGGGSSSAIDPQARSITSFALSDGKNTTNGIIVGKTISVIVPHGTDITKLTPKFKFEGANVSIGGVEQVSGKATLDFTKPISYTVTSKEGSITTYKVNLLVASENANDILAFSLNGNTGIITNNRISVIVPYGTDVKNLVATYTTTGKAVYVGSKLQLSAYTPNDFTNPVRYDVTAVSGLVKSYQVHVVVATNEVFH